MKGETCDVPIKSFVGLRVRMYTFTTPVGIYMLKVNNRNTRTRCEICSKLTIKTEHISHLLVFLLLTLNR